MQKFISFKEWTSRILYPSLVLFWQIYLIKCYIVLLNVGLCYNNHNNNTTKQFKINNQQTFIPKQKLPRPPKKYPETKSSKNKTKAGSSKTKKKRRTNQPELQSPRKSQRGFSVLRINVPLLPTQEDKKRRFAGLKESVATGRGSSIRRAERSRNRNCLPSDRIVVRLGGVASH